MILTLSRLKVLPQTNIKDNNLCSEVEIWPVTEILQERVTQIALYKQCLAERKNPHLLACSTFYSGYSTCVVMMQNGNNDIMMDVIRAIDTIRTRAHALSWGLHKSGCFCVLML